MMVNAGQVTAPGQVAGVNAGQVGTGFGFDSITNQQVQGRGVQEQQIGPLSVLSAPSVGQTSAVQTGNIDRVGQTGAVGVGNIDRVGQTSAVQTGQIGVDPITAQQVQGQTVQGQSLAQTDLSPYQNQFDSQVIDAALGDLDRARQMTQNQNAARAVSAGAFGGDRQALVESETNRNFADQAARTAANLRLQGFTNAQQQAQADLNRAQQAASQTAQLGQQAALANQRATLAGDTTSAQLGLQGQTETGRQALQSGLAAQAQNTQRALANQAASRAQAQLGLQSGSAGAKHAKGACRSACRADGRSAKFASRFGPTASEPACSIAGRYRVGSKLHACGSAKRSK
jgi:hypothetical protein